jgi:hypothetical protein
VWPLYFRTHTANPLPLACPPTPLLVVFGFLLVRQTIPPDLTIHTLAVPLSQIYSIYSTKHLSPFSPMPWLSSYFRFRVWFSSCFSCCLFSVFLKMSPDGGLDNVMVSKSLLTLSFSISFSSSTTLFLRFSILLA